jgi:hypothetical protein
VSDPIVAATLTALRDGGVVARIVQAGPLAGVRAGPALVRNGGRLLAIQDDAFAAAWVDPVTWSVEPLVLHGSGAALPKAEKPDFEAAFEHDDHIWVLGSGSRNNRCYVARVDPRRGETTLFNALPLYGAIERALGQRPNIEGAVPLPDRLRLFQRGPGRQRDANYIVDVSLDALPHGTPRVLDVRPCNLGMIGALHLGFTDAAPLGRKFIVYLAVAEDTPDGIADGPIAGAAVGVIEGMTARWNVLLEADGTPSRRKVEGVVLDDDGGAWLLTDPDDPALPAELCRVQLDF